MTWLLMLILLHDFVSQETDACLDISVMYSCGASYSIDEIEDACVRYHGEGFLWDCTLEFTNSDRLKQKICIKPETLQLSCYTVVRYYKNFAGDFFGFEREFTCGQISYDEWCDDSMSVFITLNSYGGSDQVTLNVYLETESTESTESISTGLLVAICISSAFALCVIAGCVIAFCKLNNRKMQVSAVQTTSEARTIPRQSPVPSPVPPSARMNSQTVDYQSLTHGSSGYQPRLPPLVAPPSYEFAMSSIYDVRMMEHKLELDTKPF